MLFRAIVLKQEIHDKVRTILHNVVQTLLEALVNTLSVSGVGAACFDPAPHVERMVYVQVDQAVRCQFVLPLGEPKNAVSVGWQDMVV